MALSKAIFATAPTFGQTDIVGRFRSGAQEGGRPIALSAWRITTGDPELAARVAKEFGGKPAPWDTATEEGIEIYTDQDSVRVIVEDIFAEMTLWGRNKPIRSCDGIVQNDDNQTPCACPADFAERKAKSREGSACQPNIRVRFRLPDMPEKGLWKFQSSSWQLAQEIPDLMAHLKAGESGAGTLSLKLIEWTTKAGETRKFTKPVLQFDSMLPA